MQVPDSITSWVGEAVGLSTSQGLGVAEPALLKTFKPFFLDFTLPPLVIRGEQVKIPLSVYNYLGTCAEVPTPPRTWLFPSAGGTGVGLVTVRWQGWNGAWVGNWGVTVFVIRETGVRWCLTLL